MIRQTNALLRASAVVGLLLSGAPLAASPASAQGYTIQGERALHPHMARAINQMYDALREMESAPDEFGGNKAVAIEQLRGAIHAAKRALYFRLRMDDRALEGVR